MLKLVYGETSGGMFPSPARDLVARIREQIPEFTPCAYLNGTEQPDSFKWLLAGRVGTKGKIHGYVGPKFMEIIQSGTHLLTGKYLAYAKPKMTRKGRSMLLLSPFDKGVRRIADRTSPPSSAGRRTSCAACTTNPSRSSSPSTSFRTAPRTCATAVPI